MVGTRWFELAFLVDPFFFGDYSIVTKIEIFSPQAELLYSLEGSDLEPMNDGNGNVGYFQSGKWVGFYFDPDPILWLALPDEVPFGSTMVVSYGYQFDDTRWFASNGFAETTQLTITPYDGPVGDSGSSPILDQATTTVTDNTVEPYFGQTPHATAYLMGELVAPPGPFWTRIVNAVVYDPFSEEMLLRFTGLEGQQSSNTAQTVVFEGRDFNFGAASLNFVRTLNPIPAGSSSLLATLVRPVPNYDNSLPDITSALASFSVDSNNSSFLELREVRLYDAAGDLFFTGDGDYLKSINPNTSWAHTADGIELPNSRFSSRDLFLYIEGAPYSGGGRIELDVWGTSNGTGMVVDYSVSDLDSEQSTNNHRGQGFPIWQAEGTIDLTDASEAYTEITVESYDGRSRVFDLVVDSGLSSGTVTFQLFGGLLWQLDGGQPPTDLTGAFANNRDGSGASIVSKGDGTAWVTTPNTIMDGLNYMDIVVTDTATGDQQTVRVFTGGTDSNYR